MLAKPQLWYPGINQQHPLARGVVGLWPLWEGAGSQLGDVSGHVRNGTWSGTGKHWVGSQLGWVGRFNGTNDYAGLVDVNYGIANGYTLSAWVKTSTTALGSIIGRDESSTFRFWQFRFDADGTIRFIRFNSSNGIIANFNTTGTYNDDVWHLAVATFSIKDGSRIYVDGVEDGTNATTTANHDGTGRTPAIGARSVEQPAELYLGLIGSALLHNRGLVFSEIKQLYTDPFALIRSPQQSYLFAAVPPSFVPYPYPTHELSGGFAA